MGAPEELQDFLAVSIAAGLKNPAGTAYRRYRVPRPAISRQLKQLVERGVIAPSGKTRSRRYEIILTDQLLHPVLIAPGTAEHDLWEAHIAPRLRDCPDNVRDICHYGFTEMVNNAIDHSEAESLVFAYQRSRATVRLSVLDSGIGIFRKLQRDLEFAEKRAAVFELCKGKLTTDPQHHTGEGIFFATRLFDVFSLISEELAFARFWGGRDMLLEDVVNPQQGTSVDMIISLNSKRELADVFDHYTATQDDFAFAKTHILVNLARSGTEQLVSRSQAKRVLARFQQFKELTLDFEGVTLIGPAFADEIFRVFRAENPSHEVTWINTNATIERAIKRAIAARRSSTPDTPGE